MNLHELAAAVVLELTPAAQEPGAPKRSNLTSSIMTLFRPYVEQAVTGAAPKQVRDAADRRERRWCVSLAFYTGTIGAIDKLVAESDGRECDADGKPITYGGDVVTGLDAVAALIADYASNIQAPHVDYSLAPMSRALALLRPTISRQGGHATMRRTSACGRWHLIADIFREGSFPNA